MKLNNCLKNSKCIIVALLIIIAVLVPSFSSITLVVAEEQAYQTISVDVANRMITKQNKYSNIVILDVRTQREYDLGHLHNAILVPLGDLTVKMNELEDYKTSEIIIYCKSGYRSQQASEILVEYGFAKVYNMIGGILAWIDADYPIWTTSHHITVDEITDKKFELLIEPQLLYYTGCSSCNENQECPIEGESINITSEILEQREDQIVILKNYEFNGTVYEFIHTRTILWSYDKFTNNYNKSAYFISTEITSDNFYFYYYQLEYIIYHKNYILTINTYFEPLNSEIYNSSFTSIKYIPLNGKAKTSMEFVYFNMSVILSQQYDILAKVTEEMAKIYEKSEDLDLMELYYGYTNMGEGIRSLSELVKERLVEYDYQILESYATLMDYPVNGGDPPPPPPPEGCFGGDPYWDCFWCKAAVNGGFVGTCAAILLASVWFFPAAGAFSWCMEALYWFLILYEATAVCMMFGCC